MNYYERVLKRIENTESIRYDTINSVHEQILIDNELLIHRVNDLTGDKRYYISFRDIDLNLSQKDTSAAFYKALEKERVLTEERRKQILEEL